MSKVCCVTVILYLIYIECYFECYLEKQMKGQERAHFIGEEHVLRERDSSVLRHWDCGSVVEGVREMVGNQC